MWKIIRYNLAILITAVTLLVASSVMPIKVAHAQSNSIQHEDAKPISQHALERLQHKPAADPSQSIGKTTITTGKAFRENLPQTVDSDLRQLTPDYDPGETDAQNAREKAQVRVEQASQQAQSQHF